MAHLLVKTKKAIRSLINYKRTLFSIRGWFIKDKHIDYRFTFSDANASLIHSNAKGKYFPNLRKKKRKKKSFRPLPRKPKGLFDSLDSSEFSFDFSSGDVDFSEMDGSYDDSSYDESDSDW